MAPPDACVIMTAFAGVVAQAGAGPGGQVSANGDQPGSSMVPSKLSILASAMPRIFVPTPSQTLGPVEIVPPVPPPSPPPTVPPVPPPTVPPVQPPTVLPVSQPARTPRPVITADPLRGDDPAIRPKTRGKDAMNA